MKKKKYNIMNIMDKFNILQYVAYLLFKYFSVVDDLTTLTMTKPCTVQLLRKLQENIKLACMKMKPRKSRSISIVKGKLKDRHFHIGEEPIPTVSEKPV